MDIQKWLNDTPDAKTSLESIRTPSTNIFQRPEKPRPVFEQKHTPKRPKSDSSLLDPQPHSHRAPPKHSNLSTGRSPDVSAHSDVSCPSRSDSTESESSSHRYARKPRRKTRPERYEPKPVKERGKHVQHSRRDKSKKTGRKSKRKKGEKPGSGVAQSFHAKNVSRDRLTLKPREQLGIFNKGKTSTAIRGRGLPDLVFSEMKFLQKEKGQPELAPQQEAPKKKKRKKDHAHTREGEISAFFMSVRPALAEEDSNEQTQGAQGDEDTTVAASRHEPKRSTKSSCIVPTVEVPDRASYLGFGSRGPRHESTSYVSWSESVHEPEVTPQHPEQGTILDKDPSEVSKLQGAGTTTGEDDQVFKRPAPHSLRGNTHDSFEHFVVSSVVRSGSHHRASQSHSYPAHTSSPRKLNLVDRAAKSCSTDPAASPSSMPPSVPARAGGKLRHRNHPIGPRPASPEQARRPQTKDASTRQQSVAGKEESESEMELQTSSGLEKVILQCNHTFNEQRRINASQRRHTELPEAPVRNDGRDTNTGPGVDRLRHVRFLDIPSPVAPNFSGPGIYEQQAYHQAVSLEPFYREEQLLSDSYSAGWEYIDGSIGIPYGEANWKGASGEPASYGLDAGERGYTVEESLASGEMVQHLASENSIVAPGFWRPNRLY